MQSNFLKTSMNDISDKGRVPSGPVLDPPLVCFMYYGSGLLQGDSEGVLLRLLEFLSLEMQPSVRLFQEWICTRLLARFPDLIPRLWPAFVTV